MGAKRGKTFSLSRKRANYKDRRKLGKNRIRIDLDLPKRMLSRAAVQEKSS